MTIKVCVAGATGWVGKPLCLAVAGAEDLSLVGAVSRTSKGRSLREAVGGAVPDVTVSGSVAEALETPCDVLVDYTKADAVKGNVLSRSPMSNAWVEDDRRIRVTFRIDAALGVVTTNGMPYRIGPGPML